MNGLYWINENAEIKNKHGHIIKPGPTGTGYVQVILRKNGKNKKHRLHRLVAQTFIPNPDNLPEVNHKDENKVNNKVENLEWCDKNYNTHYGTGYDRLMDKVMKKQGYDVI